MLNGADLVILKMRALIDINGVAVNGSHLHGDWYEMVPSLDRRVVLARHNWHPMSTIAL